MAQTFDGAVKFPSNFDVQVTQPLDTRLVVDSEDDLTNGSISAPYQGMAVTIKGKSELWILKTQGIKESRNINNWAKVSGSGSIDDKQLNELRESLGILTDLVGVPDGSEEDATGLFREIEQLKKGGVSSSLGYTIPIMTPKMASSATNDPLIDFDENTDAHILTDYDAGSLEGETENQTMTSVNGTYLDVMMRAIRSLQMEVARLKNSFTYGIDSYTNYKTAKSVTLGDYEDVKIGEPLWAIDPGYLSEVQDSSIFNTFLDQNHSFTRIGDGTINVSVEGQLTFENCRGVFNDGDGSGNDLTLYHLKDSKLITYLVTDRPNIVMNLISIDDKTKTRDVSFSNLMKGNSVNKYGFCVVISRKVKDTKKNTEKGFNYVYFSIINYETDKKIYEGYLTSDGTLSDTRVDLDERYSINSLTFDRLTLSRMKFYTKFEDFSDEVISSAPSESDYKYEVAHITIRSVENSTILNAIKQQLKDGELVWNKSSKTLHIKSNGNIYLIGANTNVDTGDSDSDSDNNNYDDMTNKEILTALKKMGLVINVKYKKDLNGVETDEIESVSDMSLAPISDFTFVNSDTNKKFTFTVDTEGNLVGKDNSTQTIDEFMTELGSVNAGKYDEESYEAVRGFSSDFLFRKSGIYNLDKGVNLTSDAGKKSDRLRVSSFYAPITTDTAHGCTHSFIELENTSEVDIPLTGVYLHFYNPSENNYKGGVHHLALDGVIPAGGTYLVRGAKHAEFEDESAFIKVKTFDKEWYENGKLISFEQIPVITKNSVKADGTTVTELDKDNSLIKTAYRFCLTYGLPELKATDELVKIADNSRSLDINTYDLKNFPNSIKNPRFIDSCSYSTFADVAKQTGVDNPWYINGSKGVGITITPNTMFRLMFALDPAKQAFNGFNAKDSSRVRYNKGSDLMVLKLDKEFIGYPFSDEIIKIDRYTPKASFEHKNVMTDKTQLDTEKPNMVTCSFGVDVYNTRCFNWISCGTFDEYVWIRKQGDSKWETFQSYTTISEENTEKDKFPHRKEYSKIVNNAAYARIIDRFPGNNVLFTSHKCVVVFDDVEKPTIYEYVVGRPNKDSQPDTDHTNEVYTFTLYPRTYEGRVYQITDQQGFHWIEYQVWAASATYLNSKISEDMSKAEKTFPILINTGDMTQSGARINEWLDYYNAGKCLFNHLEQINCVGNNDLCPIDPNDLGTGNDSDKSNSRFFHYFYCFDVKDSDRYKHYSVENSDNAKFFSGETLVVKSHTGTITTLDGDIEINVTDDKYIPSFYYFKTNGVLYVIVNSEIPEAACQKWFGLCSSNKQYVNIYTGIESIANGQYDETIHNYFTPLYETMFAWLNDNNENSKKKIVVAMHEMPFTVITNASLSNSNNTYLPSTRNFPLGTKSRVGSNVNQLNLNENRGTFWCSRLLEYFGCKIVIGGHKHTYALSYPIKERYTWTHEGTTHTHESGDIIDGKYDIKPMKETLADEAGENPEYNVSWSLELNEANRTEFYIRSSVESTTTLSTTKTPYIPSELYKEYGESVSEIQRFERFRCCTPIDIDKEKNPNYDGFITYSMCQATGYKLKSNKELPSKAQVFSKIIPMTTHGTSSDSPSAEQLYPMYSVLKFGNNNSELNVEMARITGIFATNGTDTFNQSKYGKGPMKSQYLCTVEKEDCDYVVGSPAEQNELPVDKSGITAYRTDENKIYVSVYNVTKDTEGKENISKSWKEYTERMYGKWLDEDAAIERLNRHIATPETVSDNRYLHIKF